MVVKVYPLVVDHYHSRQFQEKIMDRFQFRVWDKDELEIIGNIHEVDNE